MLIEECRVHRSKMALRYSVKNSRELRNVEEGDLIEFPRRFYSHWAVYVGDGEVVHVTATDGDHIQSNPNHICTLCGVNFDKAVVKKDKLTKVAEGKPAYVNNTLDEKITPHRKSQIVRDALSKLGQKGYNLLMKNCEHFAKFCRYGEERSDQVREFAKYTAVGTTVGVGLILLSAVFGGRDKR